MLLKRENRPSKTLSTDSMPNTDLLLKYESDRCTEDEFLQLFQEIYDTQAWKWLQGHYGRTLNALAAQGLIELN
tara:strand:+ start:366 stop:587 length:222 start_codon:yes stop_codon:yes gene_type:complete